MTMRYVISIDAGGTFFKSAIVSENAEVLSGTALTIPARSDADAGSVREGYEKTLTSQLDNAQRLGIKISAVAVDTPGPFDYESGFSLMRHKFKAIYKTPLRPWIKAVIGDIPVTFIHDSAAFLTGEMWNSPYGEYRSAAGTMLGTGLGFATMKDGRVLLAPDGSPLYSVWGQKLKPEDISGCDISSDSIIAEDVVSGRGISKRYALLTGLEASAKDIEHLANEGDEAAKKVYADTGRVLGRVTAPYLELIGAEVFILGGQISRAAPLFTDELEKSLSAVTTLKKIIRSERLDTSHMLGAAYNCFSRLQCE